MAHRHVQIYSVAQLAKAQVGDVVKTEQDRESALKFLTRSLATTSDGKGEWRLRGSCKTGRADVVGWVAGSIEGRISVEYVDKDPAAQAQKYAFRAHRQNVDSVDQVYPINAIAYHPT